MDITKDVQGVAVYGEFARPNATTQVIVTPDGYDSDGNVVTMNIVRRTVTTDSPRKQWRFSTVPEADEATIRTLVANGGSAADKETYCDERMRYASSLFDQLTRGDWTLINEPILIEVSKIDLDAIRASKTPTKLLYRVTQSRSALGFPSDLVNTEVAPRSVTATVSSTL